MRTDHGPGVGLTLLPTNSALRIFQDVSAHCDEYCLPPAVYTELAMMAPTSWRTLVGLIVRATAMPAVLPPLRSIVRTSRSRVVRSSPFLQVLVARAGDQSPMSSGVMTALPAATARTAPINSATCLFCRRPSRGAGPDGSGQ